MWPYICSLVRIIRISWINTGKKSQKTEDSPVHEVCNSLLYYRFVGSMDILNRLKKIQSCDSLLSENHGEYEIKVPLQFPLSVSLGRKQSTIVTAGSKLGLRHQSELGGKFTKREEPE